MPQNYVILIYLYLQHNLEQRQRNKRPKARKPSRVELCEGGGALRELRAIV